ncbi:MAG: hypothetical protein KME27_01570 [Lyngbya sp. HA4199-MV5]|nr:hypothetical protein [Lyngbya sp. HA4199-MV5]
MVQDFTAFRKISFQTVDVEVALAEIEYQYLKFICEATLRNSDEVLREQIRHLHIAGLPSFDEWRKQDTVPAMLLPAIETNTIPTTAIESQDAPIETIAEPVVKVDGRKKNGRKPSEPTATAKVAKAKPSKTATASSAAPGSAAEKLVNVLSDQATAKLTSRTVIEQQHELLSAVLKEGKSYDDLAAILTSHGAKISASTLRNYISAARRLAKTGKASKAGKSTTAKATSVTAIDAIAPEPSTAASVEPTSSSASTPSAAETPVEAPTPAPAKPKRGRPKAAAKTSLERETSIKAKPGRKPKEAVAQAPAPKRRKARV